jgi:hypothetical protein
MRLLMAVLEMVVLPLELLPMARLLRLRRQTFAMSARVIGVD